MDLKLFSYGYGQCAFCIVFVPKYGLDYLWILELKAVVRRFLGILFVVLGVVVFAL